METLQEALKRADELAPLLETAWNEAGANASRAMGLANAIDLVAVVRAELRYQLGLEEEEGKEETA